MLAVIVSTLTGEGLLDSLRNVPKSPPPAPDGDAGPVTGEEAAEARERLEGVETAEPRPRGDYERDEFGSSWVDTDDNGCSTRNDILARDLEEVAAGADCKVLSGVLDDPYTGERIEFSAEDPQAVQIDHVVPLSLAWRMGAADWNRDRRVEFANDPANLLAADGPANGRKGDAGPGEWQPYEGYRCSYAVVYIGVTRDYGLPLAPKDRQGLADMLDTCAGTALG